jgi:hypothetical protein
VFSAAFSESGQTLVLATSGPEKLVAYGVSTKQQIRAITTSLPDVAWMAVEGNLVVCWSKTGRTEVIPLQNEHQRRELSGPIAMPPVRLFRQGLTPMMLALEPAGNGGCNLSWCDLTARGSAEIQLDEPAEAADVLAASSDGKLVAIRRQKSLALVGLPEGREVTRLEGPEGYFHAVALTTAKGQLAFSAPGAHLWVVDLSQLSAQPRWRIPSGEELAAWFQPTSPSAPTLLPPPSNALLTNKRLAPNAISAVKVQPGSGAVGGAREIAGWEFQPATAVTVTELGVFDWKSDGLDMPHEVAIWTLSDERKPLARAVVPAGTAAPLLGYFRWASVEPVVLRAGTKFIIAAHYPSAKDMVVNMKNPHGLTIDYSQVSVLGRRYDLGRDKLEFPRLTTDGQGAVSIGPSFRFELAP